MLCESPETQHTCTIGCAYLKPHTTLDAVSHILVPLVSSLRTTLSSALQEGGDAVIAWAMTFAKAQGLKGQAATEVAAKLAEAELSKSRLGDQLSQWSNCAGELEGLLREKQEEVARLQGSRGAPSAPPPSQGGELPPSGMASSHTHGHICQNLRG